MKHDQGEVLGDQAFSSHRPGEHVLTPGHTLVNTMSSNVSRLLTCCVMQGLGP